MTTPSTTLTHRAAIAAGRRDNAGARPAASCGAVLAQPFCPPARPFQAACNLNIGCSKCKKGGIHGAETLGPRRVLPKSPVPSPKSLPFWQSPPLPGSPVAFASPLDAPSCSRQRDPHSTPSPKSPVPSPSPFVSLISEIRLTCFGCAQKSIKKCKVDTEGGV